MTDFYAIETFLQVLLIIMYRLTLQACFSGRVKLTPGIKARRGWRMTKVS